MATFDTSGLDKLVLDLEELRALPDDVLLRMLEAEGQVVAQAQRRKLSALGLVDSGQLRDSVTVDRRLRKKGGTRYLLVTLKGTRRGKKTTNAEVGFIQEFGAPKRGIKPRQWMRLANEESAGAAVDAAEGVYRGYLEGKGL